MVIKRCTLYITIMFDVLSTDPLFDFSVFMVCIKDVLVGKSNAIVTMASVSLVSDYSTASSFVHFW